MPDVAHTSKTRGTGRAGEGGGGRTGMEVGEGEGEVEGGRQGGREGKPPLTPRRG